MPSRYRVSLVTSARTDEREPTTETLPALEWRNNAMLCTWYACLVGVRRADGGLSVTESAIPDYRRRGGHHGGDTQHGCAVDDRPASCNCVRSMASADRKR